MISINSPQQIIRLLQIIIKQSVCLFANQYLLMFDPRATQIYNTSNDQQQISEALEQLKKNSHINVFFVLSNYLDCPELKNEPQFFKILFDRNIDVVIELIEWMLIPKQIIKKRKIKTNVDSYPYQCRELLKDNWCFYEEFYLALRRKKIQFSTFTKFLKKQYFDRTTIYTALGYFGDVMVPFAKYDFSGSYNIMKSLQQLSDKDSTQTFCISRIFTEGLTKQLVGYSYYDAIFQFLKSVILSCLDNSTQVNFGKILFFMILKQCQTQELLLKSSQLDSQELQKKIDIFQNICSFSKQLLANVKPPPDCAYPISLRLLYLYDTIARSEIIEYCANQLIKSKYCGNWFQQQQKMYSSADYEVKESLISVKNKQMLQMSLDRESKITGTTTTTGFESQDTELVQIVAKLLGYLVDIYGTMPKYWKVTRNPNNQAPTPISLPTALTFSQAMSTTPPQSFLPQPLSPKKRKKQHKPITFQIYQQILYNFHQQIQYVLNNLEILIKYVYQPNNNRESNISGSGELMSPRSMKVGGGQRGLPFSSGENVKVVTMMKYEVLRLVYACLQVGLIHDNQQNTTTQQQKQQSQTNSQKQATQQPQQLQTTPISLPPFKIRLQKLYILQIIKKYLTQNRWNNMTHILITQISRVLILWGYDYIKKSIQKDKLKKFSESFLAFLIENFNRKDFVFLNTVKFTTQGNLHAIYSVAKDLAYSLNSSNQLVIFINEFEHWRKFIINDLKNFEDKLFPKALKPPALKEEEEQNFQVRIDEAQSINKLVQNISFTDKWPKRNRRRSFTKSMSISSPNNANSFSSAQKVLSKGQIDPEPQLSINKQKSISSSQSIESPSKQQKLLRQQSMTPSEKKDSQWHD